MQKIIFLGTDLHGNQTELASKTVRNIVDKIKSTFLILSIQNEKRITESSRKTVIVPKLFSNRMLRLIIQSILLPIYLSSLRIVGYNKIATFWVTNSVYHYLLFRYLKLINYKIYFTVISGYDSNFNNLQFCDIIICQSQRMKEHLGNIFPTKNIVLIYPMVNLSVFQPSGKKIDIVVGSIPYKKEFLNERGIITILESVLRLNTKSIFIFRGDETYNLLSKYQNQNLSMIRKDLNEKDLSNILGESKIVSTLYFKNAPDMPLSAIEGLSCGCTVLCTSNMGISDIVRDEECGVVIEDMNKIDDAIITILENKSFGRNSRKVAEKYFDEDINITKYLTCLSH